MLIPQITYEYVLRAWHARCKPKRSVAMDTFPQRYTLQDTGLDRLPQPYI